jgi:hypothetical protein
VIKSFKFFINENFLFDIDINQLYQDFNKKYFNNELPVIPIKLTTMKRAYAQVVFKNGKPSYISISKVFDFSKDLLCYVLLHEMVHVYIGDDSEYYHHGPKFNKKFNEVLELSGTPKRQNSIPIATNFKTKVFDVVAQREKDKYYIAKFKKGFITPEIKQQIIDTHADESDGIYFFQSDNPYLNVNVRKNNSLRNVLRKENGKYVVAYYVRFYNISKDHWQEIVDSKL